MVEKRKYRQLKVADGVEIPAPEEEDELVVAVVAPQATGSDHPNSATPLCVELENLPRPAIVAEKGTPAQARIPCEIPMSCYIETD